MRHPLIALFPLFLATAVPSTSRAGERDDHPAITAAVHDNCSAPLVFLGETANHDSAEAIRMKSALARRLIEDCHFDAIVFESSMVEFLDLERRAAKGEAINAQQIDDAVGGIWSYTAEFQPFAAFLADYRRTHGLTLAGMDGSTDTSTEHYVPDGLTRDFIAVLPAPARAGCSASFATRFAHADDPSRPYTTVDKKRTHDCLQSIAQQLLIRDAEADRPLRAMVASFSRFVDLDLEEGDDWTISASERDRSMFLNLEWQIARLPHGSKVLVWGATTHFLRPPEVEQRAAVKFVPMGWHIALESDLRPKIIAVSALGGSAGRHQVAPLPAAPEDSLESAALNGTTEDVAYLDAKALAEAGARNARIVADAFRRADWSKRIDGLIVVREDHPLTLLR